VNLGNPGEFTMNQLMLKVSALLPEKKVAVRFCELPQDDPKQRKPDIFLARTELGWAPEVSLLIGLAHTIEYFREVI
jgi:UDP-glucuronate decarboxylase